MKTETINLKTKNESGAELTASVTYDTPETLQEALDKFGEPAVFALVRQQLLTNVGNCARVALREGNDAQAAASGYVPGQKRERGPVDPVAQALGAFAKMTDEKKLEFLADLKAKMGIG